GIEYRYESPYEHDTASSQHGQYYPDFYYPGIGLYHEHFALDKEGNPPPHFKDYAEGVRWKREIHERFETELIETTSATLRSGQAFEDLERELKKRGLELNPRLNRMPAGQKPPTGDQLARTFRVFMAHAKSNRLTHNDLNTRLEKRSKHTFRFRHRVFLALYQKIADEWQSRLRAGNFVDFEDMLNDAADLIEAMKWQNPYKLIMVDEFQDTSRARARLIGALLDKPGLFLFAVGDDWQSINRFAGADISVMRDFGILFNRATTSQLTKTFRCPQSLCDVSSQFISKNPEQLKKVVVGDKDKQGGSVFCISLPDEADINQRIQQYLEQLSRLVRGKKTDLNKDGKISVLVLGRYGFDEPDEINRWRAIFSDTIELSFSTVHRARGGEADYVIIPHMVSGRYGFPSGMEDDPVFQLAMPGTDRFPFSEERRVFYVALTRARRRVIIFTLDHMNSEFLVELARDGLLEIKTTKAATRICPSCESGTLSERNGKFGPFVGCSRHPRCNYTEKFPHAGH
ncbi:MAG: hypothetical protein DRR42_18605, partial [Gammaproteobacteria bacterium]